MSLVNEYASEEAIEQCLIDNSGNENGDPAAFDGWALVKRILK